MTEALIFDLDGVLVNTVPAHYQAWAALATQHNIPFTRRDMDRFRGVHRSDCVRLLFEPRQLTDAEVAAFSEIKNQNYLNMLSQTRSHDLLVAGAIQLLEAGANAGYRIGIASSSTNAVMVSEQTGLSNLVEVVADGNAVIRSKPKPDIFLWVAGALGAHPSACVVFEDSVAGVTAARTAGMHVIGIGDRERLQDAHEVYDHLGAVSLRALNQQTILD